MGSNISKQEVSKIVNKEISSYEIDNKKYINNQLSNKLGNYVERSNLSNQLNNYVTIKQLSNNLGNFVQTADLDNTLGNYVESSNLSNLLSNYATTTDLLKFSSKYITFVGENQSIIINYGFLFNKKNGLTIPVDSKLKYVSIDCENIPTDKNNNQIVVIFNLILNNDIQNGFIEEIQVKIDGTFGQKNKTSEFNYPLTAGQKINFIPTLYNNSWEDLFNNICTCTIILETA